MVQKKKKSTQKTGAEILDLYKEMKKLGVTPEQVMMYMLGYLQHTKSTKIGMDIHNDAGAKFCITVEVNEGTTDEQISNCQIKPKCQKTIPPGVT